MLTPAIKLEGLTKYYGHNLGVANLTFEVYPGEVVGFLGPNGAGKTTAMRALVGLLKINSGHAAILGMDVSTAGAAVRIQVGYLPGSPSLYENLTGWEHLVFLARMRGTDCKPMINSIAERLDLDLHRHIRDLSKGNQQKVGVVQAFMHQPEVLILDEPTSGLDPIVQREFAVLVDAAQMRGAAILLSSHVLSEVEHLADRVVIINAGQQLLVDEISHLKQRTIRSIDLFFPHPVAREVFSSIAGIKEVHVVGNRVNCQVIGSENVLLRTAVEHGVESVQSHESSLDDIFFSIIQGGDAIDSRFIS
jgi:ABC-2 type transport system ATP-binding protein